MSRRDRIITVELGRLMAGLVPIDAPEIHFLDPFAGEGMLTAAVCDLVRQSRTRKKITVDLFEADPARFAILQQNLAAIKSTLEQAKHKFEANCVQQNFLKARADLLETPPLFSDSAAYPEYNFILATLPDFRLNHLNLPETLFAAGHLDSFLLFVKLAAQLLAEKGELITLMPRKYSAGSFYKSFRKWFLLKFKPVEICLLPPEQFRLRVFAEPVLVKFKKIRHFPSDIGITAASSADFEIDHTVRIPTEEIVQRHDPDRVLHIPANAHDLLVLQLVQGWSLRLDGLGFRVASGKITPAEAREFSEETAPEAPWLPVIRAGHLTEFSLVFPNPELAKIQQVSDTAAARQFALKNQRYVLVNRLQQKNRPYPLLAIYYAPALFLSEQILLDQQVNYISRQRGKLSLFEALGLMALLNSNLIHRYLKLINGKRPVSTSQLNHLPLPDIEKIVEIGTALNSEKEIDRQMINQIVGEKLALPEKLQRVLLAD